MSMYIDHQMRFAIEAERNYSKVWSIQRLSFSPRGWLTELKANIRQALLGMTLDADSTLYARYESTERKIFDIENILFYNVGTAGFSHLVPLHLVFERTFSNPPSPQGMAMFPHYQFYTTDSTLMANHWSNGIVLAEFSSKSYSSSVRLDRADYFWLMIKKGDFKLITNTTIPTYFGLKLIIHSEISVQRKLIPILKPMLDGIVAALQAHDGSNPVFAKSPAERLGITESDIWEMLMDDKMAMLGKTSLLVMRNGVQWNPSDDRLVRVEIALAKDGLSRSQFKIEGSLMAYMNNEIASPIKRALFSFARKEAKTIRMTPMTSELMAS